jgi:enoyl-CoA hydratase/carnithine racemase
MEELSDVAMRINRDVRIAAVILTGNDSFFSAGADLGDKRSQEVAQMPFLERRENLKAGPRMCDAWEAMEAYTIAAIEGYCIGGGAALVLACDYRVVGQSAYLRLPEIPLGMNMSWHSLPRLVGLVGPARAKQFTIFGEKLESSEALSWGMVEEVVADGEALSRAREWGAKVAALPPVPVRMSKEAINAAANALNASATFMDRDQNMLSTSTEDFREAVSAFFEKRPPKFTGN